MILIVGLGNPGEKYEKTRHNVGSRVVTEMASLNLPNVILARPQTYMNESGKAVKKLIENRKLKIGNLIVIHDDIDIPLGEFKIQKGRGSAGHKGVESIIKELGTKNFWRVRIGVYPESGKPKQVDRFVLQNFTKAEEKILKGVIKIIIEKINEI